MQNLFSKSVIIFSGLVFLSLLALNLSNYVYYTGSPGGIFYHYAIPLILAAAMFFSLRLSVPSRIVISLCLVSIVFGLYATELYLSFTNTSPKDRAAEAGGKSFDGRTKIQVITDLRREGVDAYPVMRAKSMLIENADASLVPALNVRGEGFLPLASVPLKTVVSCNESGQWLIYKSDIHGFHNPPGAWQTAPVEIAVVGDSFAHGSCVQSEQNTAALLRNRFGNVLNLGISGFGPLTELVSLREYAAPLKPKTVVWFYFEGNDLIEDLVFEKRSELLMRYYRDEDFTQGLIGHSADISKYLKVYLDERLVEAMNRVDDPNEYLMDFLTLFHLRETFGLGAVSLGVLDGGGSKGDLEMFANILDKARRSVESWDGKFYFVYLPESPRYFAAARDNDIRDHLRNEVLKQVAALKIPLIDLHPSFAAQPDPRRMFQYPGSHYSPEGYKVAADAIGRVLSDFSAR